MPVKFSLCRIRFPKESIQRAKIVRESGQPCLNPESNVIEAVSSPFVIRDYPKYSKITPKFHIL